MKVSAPKTTNNNSCAVSSTNLSTKKTGSVAPTTKPAASLCTKKRPTKYVPIRPLFRPLLPKPPAQTLASGSFLGSEAAAAIHSKLGKLSCTTNTLKNVTSTLTPNTALLLKSAKKPSKSAKKQTVAKPRKNSKSVEKGKVTKGNDDFVFLFYFCF